MKFFTYFCFIGFACSCLGQTEHEIITTELVTLSLCGGVPDYHFETGKRIVKANVSAQGIGASLDYQGSKVLSLYADPSILVDRDPDEPIPKPDFQVTLPAGEDRILLIFTKCQAAQIQVRALGISTKKLKPGDYRIFNLSQRTTYVMMNDEKLIVQPRKPADISSSTWQDETLDMQVRFGLREKEGLRQVYSSVWGHRASRRTFLFILDRDDKFNPFEIRRYHDVPTAQSPEYDE